MSDLISTIENVFESIMSNVHTALPGTIVSYDPATNRAVIRPTLPKRLADGRELPAPDVISVPMVWPTSGGATITMPVAAGDGVLLHFSSRSLDGWLAGETSSPDDPRMFDLSDAIATPGLSASRPAVHAENLVISFGGASISITPGGEIILHAVKITTDSPIESTSTIKAQGVGLTTHRHGGVMSGGSNTGGPTG